jgi:hypothetical protein
MMTRNHRDFSKVPNLIPIETANKADQPLELKLDLPLLIQNPKSKIQNGMRIEDWTV